MITDTDIVKLKDIFATKDDLNRFATKEDLNRFATKEDLKDFPTRADLKREIKEAIETYNAGLMEGIKTIIEMIGDSQERSESNSQEISHHHTILEDHSRRIQALEQ